MTLRDKLQQSFREQTAKESVQLPSMRSMVKKMLLEEVASFKQEALQELKTILQEAIGEDGALALKGDRGFTPQKGVDYFTKEELEMLKKEITPVKGKHYFDGMPGMPGLPGKGISMREMEVHMKKMLPPKPSEDELLVMIKKLLAEEGFDYYALKNRPSIPSARSLRRKIFRGGGDIVNVSDLSSSTDGTTKTFTVPFHNKALKVEMSDFPTHLYLNNGFTVASSKLQITLTVPNAPSLGSQLAFFYTI
jgi:hypothetical protein